MCMNDACVWVQVPSQACDQRAYRGFAFSHFYIEYGGVELRLPGLSDKGLHPLSHLLARFFKSMQMWLKPNASMPAPEHGNL